MSVLEKAVTSWLEKRPYLEEVAAFALACESVLAGGKVITELPKNLDDVKEKIGQGKPLLLSDIDFNISDTAGENLLMLAKLKDEAKLPDDLKAQADKLSSLSLDDAKKVVQSVISGDNESFSSIAAVCGIKEDILEYFAWVSIKKSLSGIKEALENIISENQYNAGVCPVCGEQAGTAFFKHTKRGRQRFLHCDHCGTDWAYKRIGCPYCGNNDQKKMSIKDSQDETDMRIDLCHKCMSYIKTYIGEDELNAGREGWASIHLDILMKETGFKPKGCLVKPE